METQPDFRELLVLFNARHVEYLIVGGYALAFHADKRHRWRELSRGVEAARCLDGWQALQKEAASGGDHVTADASAAHLQGNLEAWGPRWQTQRSRATLV